MNEQRQLIPLYTGERLRQERENRGISLADAALQLRIDEPVMHAIEADELDHLAPLYKRGYITAYARFLEFEETEIEQMLETVDSDHPELLTVFPEAGNPNQADRWLKATSYVLASLLVGTLAWQFTYEAVRLSQEGEELISGNENPQDANARVLLSSSTQQIEGTTHVNASIAALEILKQEREVRNSAGNEAWAALQQSREDTGTTTPLADDEFLLELSASGDSWVEISDAQGRQLEIDLVRGGTTKQYKGQAPFNIQFGRASAVSLFLDGQPVDLAPFTDGNVTQMMLDGSNHGSAVGLEESGNG